MSGAGRAVWLALTSLLAFAPAIETPPAHAAGPRMDDNGGGAP